MVCRNQGGPQNIIWGDRCGPNQVEQVAKALGEIADDGNVNDLPAGDISWQFEMPLLIRHLVDDLRTFYHEAVAAQPGDNTPNHEALKRLDL